MQVLVVSLLFSAAFGLNYFDFGLKHATNAVGDAFYTPFESTKNQIMSFEPTKNGESFELQDLAGCKTAWQMLGAAILNQSDPCNTVLYALQNLNNVAWNNGTFTFVLDSFCSANGGYCVNQYQQLYGNMIQQCGWFAPDVARALFQNATDQIARTAKALVEIVCANDNTTSFTAEAWDPAVLNITAPIGGTQTYGVTYCWLSFINLLRGGMKVSGITSGWLDTVCVPCMFTVSSWLNRNGQNQLLFAARQAVSFCDKKHNAVTKAAEYCAVVVQALEYKSQNSTWIANLQTNPTIPDLQLFCHPCSKWGFQLALRVQDLFQGIKSPGYNASIRAELQMIIDYLAISCGINPVGEYCAMKMSKYSAATLKAQLTQCIAGCTTRDKNDVCYNALYPIYKDIGCCLVYFKIYLGLPEAGSQLNGIVPLFANILQTCLPEGAPTRCAQKKVHVTFPLNNVAYAYAQAMKSQMQSYFAAALGLQSSYTNVSCVGNSDGSTTCTVDFYPDDTASALMWPQDFMISIQAANQTLYITELDVAPLDKNASVGGCRMNASLPAYMASSASVTTADDCLNFAYPASYHWDPTTQACVQNPEPTHNPSSATNIWASPLILVATLFLTLLL